MSTNSDWISPKQAARALGVSESSLKRWCDRGLLKTARTAGGHRQLTTAEVLSFAKSHQYSLQYPEILGLPAVAPQSGLALRRAVDLLTDALLAGDETQARRIVFDLYLGKHKLSAILDQVIAPALKAIGNQWECHQAEIYQERRGCQIASRILLELCQLQLTPKSRFKAIGGTFEGDHYQIPTLMVELILRESSWQATSLGTGIPVTSFLKAIEQTKPQIFWLSVSFISDPVAFLKDFVKLSDACLQSGVALVVGGRELTPELRQKMTYSTFCDTMQQLEMLSQTLGQLGKKSSTKRR